MSQITLLNDDEARYLNSLATSDKKHGVEWGTSTQYYPPTINYSDEEVDGSVGQDCDEQLYYDPPVIHMLKLGDTMLSICKKYDIHPEIVEKANRFHEITEQILQERKFVIIPSASTFTEYIYDEDQENLELAKNFCLFFPETTFGEAEYFLGKVDFNLYQAVENYQYEIV